MSIPSQQGRIAANQDIDRIWAQCRVRGWRRRDAVEYQWGVLRSRHPVGSPACAEWHAGYVAQWEARMARVKHRLALPQFLDSDTLRAAAEAAE